MTTEEKLVKIEDELAKPSSISEERVKGVAGGELQLGHILPGEEGVRGGRDRSAEGEEPSQAKH